MPELCPTKPPQERFEGSNRLDAASKAWRADRIDSLCDDDVYATAEGTFRKQDGSECSVTIHAQAKIGCVTNDDCLSSEVCTTTNPTAPADFGNAFPGWAGKSCVVPTP